jgi:hypothetical protein
LEFFRKVHTQSERSVLPLLRQISRPELNC